MIKQLIRKVIYLLYCLNTYKNMSVTISLNNHKGGVGKTMTATSLAFYLAQENYKVLAIDMDAQANLSTAMGYALSPSTPSIADVLMDTHPLKDIIVEVRPNLHLAPSSIKLSGLDVANSAQVGREFTLNDVLEPFRKYYDYIIIDCPPSIGQATINALTASNYYITITQTHLMSLKGVVMVDDAVSVLLKRINPKLRHLGLLVTFYDSRTTIAKKVMNEIDEVYGDKVFATKIRSAVALGESTLMRQSIFEYAPATNASNDYTFFCNEVINRIKKIETNNKI